MITDVKQIKDTPEGRLLLAAIAKITTESQTDKTPDEVIKQLNTLSKKMDFKGDPEISFTRSEIKGGFEGWIKDQEANPDNYNETVE